MCLICVINTLGNLYTLKSVILCADSYVTCYSCLSNLNGATLLYLDGSAILYCCKSSLFPSATSLILILFTSLFVLVYWLPCDYILLQLYLYVNRFLKSFLNIFNLLRFYISPLHDKILKGYRVIMLKGYMTLLRISHRCFTWNV